MTIPQLPETFSWCKIVSVNAPLDPVRNLDMGWHWGLDEDPLLTTEPLQTLGAWALGINSQQLLIPYPVMFQASTLSPSSGTRRLGASSTMSANSCYNHFAHISDFLQLCHHHSLYLNGTATQLIVACIRNSQGMRMGCMH